MPFVPRLRHYRNAELSGVPRQHRHVCNASEPEAIIEHAKHRVAIEVNRLDVLGE